MGDCSHIKEAIIVKQIVNYLVIAMGDIIYSICEYFYVKRCFNSFKYRRRAQFDTVGHVNFFSLYNVLQKGWYWINGKVVPLRPRATGSNPENNLSAKQKQGCIHQTHSRSCNIGTSCTRLPLSSTVLHIIGPALSMPMSRSHPSYRIELTYQHSRRSHSSETSNYLLVLQKFYLNCF